jgi:hypothetical protein
LSSKSFCFWANAVPWDATPAPFCTYSVYKPHFSMGSVFIDIWAIIMPTTLEALDEWLRHHP